MSWSFVSACLCNDSCPARKRHREPLAPQAAAFPWRDHTGQSGSCQEAAAGTEAACEHSSVSHFVTRPRGRQEQKEKAHLALKKNKNAVFNEGNDFAA